MQNSMRQIHPLAAVLTFFVISAVFATEVDWKEVAKHGGGKMKLIFTVVDEDGKPVKGAKVDCQFNTVSSNEYTDRSVFTDASGKAEASGKTDGGAGGNVTKDGYYLSRQFVDFIHGEVDFRDGKWYPYPLKKTVVLKRKGRPVPMYVFPRQELEVPRLDEDFGYDMEYGDFVEPVGDGKVADFFVRFTCVDNDEELYRTIVLSFPNALDGAYLFEKDTHSELASPHEADLEVKYEKTIVFSSLLHKKIMSYDEGRMEDNSMKENQGLVLRTRTKVDANGTLVSAHYGKIYGPMDVSNQVMMTDLDNSGCTIYFNPVENDPSIEFGEKMPRSMQKGKKRPEGHLP